MCGLTFCISKSQIVRSRIRKLNKIINHRGPDSEKIVSSKDLPFYKNKNINFMAGFKRLKIIDLSQKASQPMIYKNRYMIIFNGEIYNYLELKKFLKKKKYIFNTTSDTEVILASFDYWGENCFKKFNGMWSLIIIDLAKEYFIASRDRYGVKPLFFRKINGSLYFGSEIKQLRSLSKKNFINKDFLACNIINDYLPISNETIIEDIFQLKAGENLKFNFKKFKYHIYKWYNFSEKKFLDKKFKNQLDKAINLRLRSDVPVGMSLSGGIDSSTIASIVASNKNNNHKQIYTFSTRSNDKFDEYYYVNKFLDKYDYKNIPINLNFQSFKKNYSKLIKFHDLPITNLSVFSEWEIFRNIKKKNIKVNLDGHGADEQLCGYEKYYSLYLIQLFKNLNFIYFIKFFIDLYKSNIKNKTKFTIKILFNLFPKFIRDKVKIFFNQSINPNWIKLKEKEIDKNIDIKKNLVINENYSQFFQTSLPYQLYWSDINSMAHSVETRSPFLDFNFVETTLPAPLDKKILGTQNKFILRQTYKDILPKEIYLRNFKVGFVAPGENWLIENRKEIKKMFKESFKFLRKIFSHKCKDTAIQIIDGKKPYREWIWKIIFLGYWIKYNNLLIKE